MKKSETTQMETRKSLNEMSYRELVEEMRYMVSLLDDQPYHHEAYIADLAQALLKKALEEWA